MPYLSPGCIITPDKCTGNVITALELCHFVMYCRDIHTEIVCKKIGDLFSQGDVKFYARYSARFHYCQEALQHLPLWQSGQKIQHCL